MTPRMVWEAFHGLASEPLALMALWLAVASGHFSLIPIVVEVIDDGRDN